MNKNNTPECENNQPSFAKIQPGSHHPGITFGDMIGGIKPQFDEDGPDNVFRWAFHFNEKT